MPKKEISGYVKLQIKGGQANPAPPVGPALGQRGINIMEFCKAFNEKTKDFMGKVRTYYEPVGNKINEKKKKGDLYTDDNPKDTIKKLGYKNVSVARASVSKIPALTVTLPFIGNNPVIALTTATTAFLLFKF